MRADTGPGVGLGHVMRCLAVAQALQDRAARACFAARDIPAGAVERLRREGHHVHMLRAAPGTPEDAQETLDLARDLDAGWILVDGYRFGPSHQSILGADRPRRRLAWLDDLAAAGRWDVDVLVNPGWVRPAAYEGRVPPTSRLLLGPSYALLRRELRRASDPPTRAAEPRSLLVSFGGADDLGLTERALNAMADPLLNGLRAVFVVGPGSPRSREIMTRAGALGPRLTLSVDPPDMGALLRGADLALAAAGGTSWELAHHGLPAALVVAAENQRLNAQGAEAAGTAIVAGGEEVTPAALVASLERLRSSPSLRQQLAEAGRSLVDGEGAARLVQALIVEHSA